MYDTKSTTGTRGPVICSKVNMTLAPMSGNYYRLYDFYPWVFDVIFREVVSNQMMAAHHLCELMNYIRSFVLKIVLGQWV